MIWLSIIYGTITLSLGIFFFWIVNDLTDGLKRLAAVFVLALVVVSGVLAFAELLSRPKPMNMELLSTEVEILGSIINPNEGIYLWVRANDKSMPRYYSLSWNRDVAEKLRSLLRKKQRGQKLKIKPENILQSSRTTPLLYLTDAPIMPLKTPRENMPQIFEYNPEQQR